MPLIKLYFTPALLLLVLTCPQVSQSVPVMSKGPLTESCVIYAKALLQNITETLTQNKLFSGFDCTKLIVEMNETKTPSVYAPKNKLSSGFDCTKLIVEMNMETKTPSVCAPKESTCSGIVKSNFDQESCLTNIGEDLHHYYKFLAAHPDPDSTLAVTVLFRLRELVENCFPWSLPTDLASEEAAAECPSTFDGRVSLCKVLKVFQVRSITINRAIAYMTSGEHTK